MQRRSIKKQEGHVDMKNKINSTKYFAVLIVIVASYCSLKAESPARFFDLQRAVMQGKTEEVRLLLGESPQLVHERDEGGENILFDLDITEQNMDEVGKLLIEKGADVNAQDETGMTALHQAVVTKNLALVAFLLNNGADPTIEDNQGITPLSLVVRDDADLRALFAKHSVEL